MLKKRIIPVLLWDGIQCVKPVSFQRPYRKLGSMEQYVQVMERRGIDELIIIDIEATPQKRSPNYVKLRHMADNLFCPLTYGGGIRSLDDISMALNNGADKVTIKTSSNIIEKAAHKFGSQAIVAVLDVMWCTGYKILAIDYLQKMGAGEIIITDTQLDGTMKGYNLDMIKEAVQRSKIPIIANGGCGEPKHMEQAFDMGASAVAAGSMFLYTEHTPKSCAKCLTEKGHNTRT